MPQFNPVSKAMSRLFSHRNLFRQKKVNCASYDQIRCLTSIAVTDSISSPDKTVGYGYRNYNLRDHGKHSSASIVVQKRRFLGCGDGEVGNMLSKVHEERRVLGYSPEQLFNVVAAVDMYEDFLPWCQRSQITRRNPDGSFDAELEIGFKILVESYVSHVELKKPNFIKVENVIYGRRGGDNAQTGWPLALCVRHKDNKCLACIHYFHDLFLVENTTSSQSTLFDHLINVWEFNPGTVPGSCDLHFLVDFKFQSPFYRQMANMFFKEVVSRLVNSFHDRCQLIYGPGVPGVENTRVLRA